MRICSTMSTGPPFSRSSTNSILHFSNDLSVRSLSGRDTTKPPFQHMLCVKAPEALQREMVYQEKHHHVCQQRLTNYRKCVDSMRWPYLIFGLWNRRVARND
jgi:hypothetical protein